MTTRPTPTIHRSFSSGPAARTVSAALLVLFAGTSAAHAAVPPADASAAGPRLENGRLVFAEGAAIPKGMSDAERRFLNANPGYFNGGSTTRGVPPTGPIWCPPEYAPADGIFVAWESFNTELAQIAKHVTTTGNANIYVVVDTAGEQTSATTAITNAGANMSRVKFYVRTTDSVWIRDYGPRYIYEGGVRAIVDHTYNRPRPNDDAFSVWVGPQRKEQVYDVGLIHGGGNFHLNGLDKGYATKLINNENPTLTQAQILQRWKDHQNLDVHLFDPFPATLDSTQHLDMWMQVFADNKVMISDWPVTGGDMTTAKAICDAAATYMQSQGYQVFRIPAREVSNVHYTYTNVVIVNNLIIIPTYTNGTIVSAGYNAQALAAWQAAAPDKTIVQVNGQSVVTLAGVFHCIVKHMPANLGGVNPVAYLRGPNGGEAFNPADAVDIRWITDDDVSVSNVDLLLSIDGGETYPFTIAAATADDGTHTWNVPDVFTNHAKVKVVARDGVGNTGFDESDAVFAIDGSCPADYDLSGFADTDDFDAFVRDFQDGKIRADIDGTGFVDTDDFDAFVALFEAGC